MRFDNCVKLAKENHSKIINKHFIQHGILSHKLTIDVSYYGFHSAKYCERQSHWNWVQIFIGFPLKMIIYFNLMYIPKRINRY